MLYPSLGGKLFFIEDPALQATCVQVYNDWLAEYCSGSPERLLGIAMVSTYDMDSAGKELEGIQVTCQNLYAALLWLEWMASLEAQKLGDEHEPLASSVHVRGGAVEQELRGKKLSVVNWENQAQVEEWQAKIVEAFGFPKAETK